MKHLTYRLRRLLVAPVVIIATAGAFIWIHLALITLGAEPTVELADVLNYGTLLGVGVAFGLLLAPIKTKH